jgi:hypothetical protein
VYDGHKGGVVQDAVGKERLELRGECVDIVAVDLNRAPVGLDIVDRVEDGGVELDRELNGLWGARCRQGLDVCAVSWWDGDQELAYHLFAVLNAIGRGRHRRRVRVDKVWDGVELVP